MAKTTASAHERVDKIESHLDKHEAVCAERWLETINRIKRLEILIIACAAGVIAFLLELSVL
tara:strand:- start:326 stop:511 length:186 start_codon:yes stop_codon:yes gene_type:complete